MNPFSSCWIRPDRNTYRFDLDLVVDRGKREAFFDSLLSTLTIGRFASIVGPHGTGKTTLLRGTESRLQETFGQVTWVTLSTEKRQSWRDVWASHQDHKKRSHETPKDCLIVDGFEQLGWWSRAALFDRVRRNESTSLVITSHRSHRFIPVCHETRWDTRLTKLLAAEKLADVAEPMRAKLWSRLENHVANLSVDAENVRDLWFAMYDEFETIRQQEHLQS